MTVYAENGGFRTTAAERFVYNTTHERHEVDKPEYFTKQGQGHLLGLIGLPFQANCWAGEIGNSNFHTATFIVHSVDEDQLAHVVKLTPWQAIIGPRKKAEEPEDETEEYYVPEDCIVKNAGLFFNVVGEKSGDVYASIKKSEYGNEAAEEKAAAIASGAMPLGDNKAAA